MNEAFFMIFILPFLIGGGALIGSLFGREPTDAEKAHYYAVKKYEREHPEDVVKNIKDMK